MAIDTTVTNPSKCPSRVPKRQRTEKSGSPHTWWDVNSFSQNTAGIDVELLLVTIMHVCIDTILRLANPRGSIQLGVCLGADSLWWSTAIA